MTHFKIVIPSYNSVRWLRKTLDSVAAQTYKNYEVCVIEDASTQAGQKEIIAEYEKKYGWKTIYRKVNHGAVANIVDGIALLNPSGDDVIVLIDGDDWLYDKHVLSKLDQIYWNEPVSLTYGQFITYPRWEIGFCRPLKHEESSGRNMDWVFSHLRTFRYYLWKRLNISDLKDCTGHYYKTAWDLAIMYPLIEMAGKSVKCVHDVLYVYNLDNPLNDHVLDLQRQQTVAEEIRKKPSYPRLVMASCENSPASSWVLWKQSAISWKNRILTPRLYELVWMKIRKMF